MLAPCLVFVLCACGNPPAAADLYGIWMSSGKDLFSVTFIAGGQCEVRTYDASSNPLKVEPCQWTLTDSGATVDTGTQVHQLQLSGTQLSDQSWSLSRN